MAMGINVTSSHVTGYTIISEVINNANIKELAVLVDGEFLMFKGKMVYVHCIDAGERLYLEFYIKSKNPLTGKYEKQEVSNGMSMVYEYLNRTELFGIKIPGIAEVEESKISVCRSMRILVIESQLYASVRAVVESKESTTFYFGSDVVDRETRNKLCTAFMRNSYQAYGNLVYSPSVSRFINKVMKVNKFYGIQKAFVPVFIDYDKVFNPFRPDDCIAKQTTLYQAAIKAGRYVEQDSVSCYFLTHEEIRKALNMQHFMRFTPAFLYRVFVGLLYPSYTEFPNKLNRNMLLRPGYLDVGHVHKSVLSTEVAVHFVKKQESIIANSESTEEERIIAKETLKEIEQYEQIDSLYGACIQFYTSLVSIGSPVLDRKEDTTVDKLYSYISEATLGYGAAEQEAV